MLLQLSVNMVNKLQINYAAFPQREKQKLFVVRINVSSTYAATIQLLCNTLQVATEVNKYKFSQRLRPNFYLLKGFQLCGYIALRG